MRRGGIPILGNGAIPGNKGHIFVPGGSYPPGAVGQQSLLDYQFDHIANPRDLANSDGLGGFYGVPDFLWVAGDGGAPTIGPALTTIGTPAVGVMPWRYDHGVQASSELYDGGSYRYQKATKVDPSVGEDTIIVIVGKMPPITTGTSGRLLSTRLGSEGYEVYKFDDCQLGSRVGTSAGVGTVVTPVGGLADSGVFCFIGIHDRAGETWTGWTSSGIGGPVAIPNGTITGDGVGIACYLPVIGALLSAAYTEIYFVSMHFDSGLAAAYTASSYALCHEICHTFEGLIPGAGEFSGYTRASSRLYYPNGPDLDAHILSPGIAPAGNVEGLGSDEQIVSVTDKNHTLVAGDLAAINARIDVGLVGTLQTETGADLAVLRSFLPWSNGVVYDIDNPTGGTLYARLGNAIGAASPSWASIRARVLAGTINLGFQTAAGGFTSVVAGITTGYVRNYGTATPLATDQQALEIPAGGRVRIILWCAGLGARVHDEVPSVAAFAASSTVVQGVFTTKHAPSDLEETYDLVCTPRLWGAASAGDSGDIVSRSGGAAGIIAVTAGGNVTTTDGTSTPSAAMSETDGSQETLRSTHGSGRLYVTQSDQTPAEAAYDGSLAASGTLIHEGSCRSVQRLLVKRNLEAGNHP